MKADLTPAPLDRRVLAGLVDTAVIVALCAAYFLVPVALLGVVLPMWGVLAAIIGYSVVPLAVFRQTLGMRWFGLMLIGKQGHAVGLGDVLFRELLGRGYFPAAFIFNLVFAYVGQLLGFSRFVMPGGLQSLFFVASLFAVTLAVLGSFRVVTSLDRRSIADLMAKSWVVPYVAAPEPKDPEERAEQRAARTRSIRSVVIAELIIAAVGLGAPWLLTRRTESTEQHAARLLKQKLEAQFKANPADDQLAAELERACWQSGDVERAKQVAAQHQQYVDQAREKRFAAELKELDQHPGDERTFGAVLEALQERERLDEAKQRYQAFVAADHGQAPYRAGYADWLMHHGFAGDAVLEMQALLKDEPDFEGVHKFLAQAYVMAERLKEAQEEYQRELLLDPEDEEAIDALAELDAELGPLPKARVAALQREVKGKKR